MNAAELEVELHKLAGRLDVELLKLAGKGEADVQRLTAEDRVLGGRTTNAESRANAAEADIRDLSRRIEDIRIDLGRLRETVGQLKADQDRWGGRVWGLFATGLAVVAGAVVTAVVTTVLAFAGFRRP